MSSKPIPSDEFGRQRKVKVTSTVQHKSRLARVALVFGALFFIPLLPLVGIATGILALRQIAARTDMSGRGAAFAGIALGAIFTFGHAFIGMQVLKVRSFATEGPREALTMALSGNTRAFRAAFDTAGQRASDDEVAAFTTALRERYGGFIDLEFNDDDALKEWNSGSVTCSYVLQFSDRPVLAEVEIVYSDPNAKSIFVRRLERISILDSVEGTLTFPSTSTVVQAE